MSDTEALDLIEHYGWGIRRERSGWTVYSAHFVTPGDASLRDALATAIAWQAKCVLHPTD